VRSRSHEAGSVSKIVIDAAYQHFEGPEQREKDSSEPYET